MANFFDSTTFRQLHEEIDSLEYQRYDNPFERKWFLASKTRLLPSTERTFNSLGSKDTIRWISRLTGVPCYMAEFKQYGNIFIYENGDYLKAHVDAGIHPDLKLRKVATLLVYLTDAELEFYTGDTAEKEDPLVWSRSLHLFKPNEAILFTNTNTAWHGVPTVRGDRRIVLTISYLAPPDWTNVRFTNPRTRAYFAKTLWDHDTPEIEKLRKMRASEEEHESVYRTDH